MLKKLIGVIASKYSTELYESIYTNLVSLFHSHSFNSLDEFLDVIKPKFEYEYGYTFEASLYDDIDDKIREILTIILIDEKED